MSSRRPASAPPPPSTERLRRLLIFDHIPQRTRVAQAVGASFDPDGTIDVMRLFTELQARVMNAVSGLDAGYYVERITDESGFASPDGDVPERPGPLQTWLSWPGRRLVFFAGRGSKATDEQIDDATIIDATVGLTRAQLRRWWRATNQCALMVWILKYAVDRLLRARHKLKIDGRLVVDAVHVVSHAHLAINALIVGGPGLTGLANKVLDATYPRFDNSLGVPGLNHSVLHLKLNNGLSWWVDPSAAQIFPESADAIRFFRRELPDEYKEEGVFKNKAFHFDFGRFANHESELRQALDGCGSDESQWQAIVPILKETLRVPEE